MCTYCDKPAVEGDLCATHARRRRRGQPLSAPVRDDTRTPFEVLQDAAIRVVDAPSEDDAAYRRAKDLLGKAALAYGKHLLFRGGRPRKASMDEAQEALARAQTRTAAAKALGVSRVTLWRWLRNSSVTPGGRRGR